MSTMSYTTQFVRSFIFHVKQNGIVNMELPIKKKYVKMTLGSEIVQNWKFSTITVVEDSRRHGGILSQLDKF